jgi:hypothetical protein
MPWVDRAVRAERNVDEFERYVWEPSLGARGATDADLEQVAKAIGALREAAIAVVAGALRDAIDQAAADAARHAAELAGRVDR